MIVAAVAAGAAGVIAVAGAVAAGRASLDAACEMYFVDDVAGELGVPAALWSRAHRPR